MGSSGRSSWAMCAESLADVLRGGGIVSPRTLCSPRVVGLGGSVWAYNLWSSRFRRRWSRACAPALTNTLCSSAVGVVSGAIALVGLDWGPGPAAVAVASSRRVRPMDGMLIPGVVMGARGAGFSASTGAGGKRGPSAIHWSSSATEE
jgi:hypothetical protein